MRIEIKISKILEFFWVISPQSSPFKKLDVLDEGAFHQPAPSLHTTRGSYSTFWGPLIFFVGGDKLQSF